MKPVSYTVFTTRYLSLGHWVLLYTTDEYWRLTCSGPYNYLLFSVSSLTGTSRSNTVDSRGIWSVRVNKVLDWRPWIRVVSSLESDLVFLVGRPRFEFSITVWRLNTQFIYTTKFVNVIFYQTRDCLWLYGKLNKVRNSHY